MLSKRSVWTPDVLTDAKIALPDWAAEQIRAAGFRSVLAMPLKAAGLKRINVHLDSLNPLTVERQMRWGSFARVWEGIMAAEAAGLVPIEIRPEPNQP